MAAISSQSWSRLEPSMIEFLLRGERLMRSFLIALLMIAGLSLATAQGASAAPASGMPIANALSQFDNTQAQPVQCR
ncbi:MAG TPA: hypothetical protein VJL90_16380, partial [Pseudorhodoplanes sp.]|nr:hypothetical protein [Pseudorhodoplanes sp.]